MDDRGLLAHIVERFAPRQWENVASESLLYLLPRPGGNKAINDLLAPLAFTLTGETWRAWVSGEADRAIPDLVAEVGGRQALMVETKFWASLTENQPLGYLRRQQSQFEGTDDPRLLLFLAPSRRRHLLTAELEQILGVKHVDIGSLAVLDSAEGRVALVDWSDLLGHLRSAFHSLNDRRGLDDLAQLEGLCDRADTEAMLPLTVEDLDPHRAQRQWEFHRVAQRAGDILAADYGFSTKGLNASGSSIGWGKYLQAPSGHVIYLWVSLPMWAQYWPTPWWVRLKDPRKSLDAWLTETRGDDEVGFAERHSEYLHIGLQAPLGVEEQRIASRLAQVVARICDGMPDASADGAAEVPEDE
jgi:hypothetical protein